MSRTFTRMVLEAWGVAGVVLLVLAATRLQSLGQLDWVRLPVCVLTVGGAGLAVVSAGWIVAHLVFRRDEEAVLFGRDGGGPAEFVLGLLVSRMPRPGPLAEKDRG